MVEALGLEDLNQSKRGKQINPFTATMLLEYDR